jgi:heat shock protein HslJ/uncharacterized lipoprotein NlpE involved in copper resistance
MRTADPLEPAAERSVAMITTVIVTMVLSLFATGSRTVHANTSENMAKPDSSATSLDWGGVYRGVVPCADCEGIETTITLATDGSYRLEARYLGKSDGAFEQQGFFTWNPEGNVIALEGLTNRPILYLVGENHLVQLDLEGRRITGPLADRYRLAKIGGQAGPPETVSLTETTWNLTELNGKPVVAAGGGKTPHLLLSTEGNRLQGFGGCNAFTGSYEVKQGMRISFHGIAATLKACPEMEVESQLFKVLETADNYALKGRGLSLHKARMAPLARFEAAQRP